MSARTTHTEADLGAMRQALASAPAPERPMSKPEALAKLAPELKDAHERGHSPESLVQLLAQRGLQTHTRAIMKAIRDHGAATAPKRARKRKLDKANSIADLQRTVT